MSHHCAGCPNHPPEELEGQFSKGGWIRTPNTVTVQVRTNEHGLTEYWLEEGKRWMPVLTAEQIERIAGGQA